MTTSSSRTPQDSGREPLTADRVLAVVASPEFARVADDPATRDGALAALDRAEADLAAQGVPTLMG